MSTLIKLTILQLLLMVLIYGDSYSQESHGYVDIRELKNRLLTELNADGYINDGKYNLTYNFSEDKLLINGAEVDKNVKHRYKDIILDFYQRDTYGIFIMAKPYKDGKIKGEIIGIKLD
ncbi:MAG: hypothetical protein KDC42_01990 [Ignavibacteriae bacterium]|nr:hypothetical protein [Ignavibacteriota bacterium]